MQPRQPNLPYGPGPRQVGDLWQPEGQARGAPVLLIHGGGWTALSKEAVAPLAALIAEAGRVVFSINYRLIPTDPWPACRDDCLAAARLLLAGGLAAHGLPAASRLVICGASAGGHLALLTGVSLGHAQVAGILSLAGPSRVDPGSDSCQSAICRPGFLADFFGPAFPPTQDQLDAASPARLAHPQAPPLRVIQSRRDELVPASHALEVVAAWHAAGVPATVDWFDGLGREHGFWTSSRLEDRQLVPDVKRLMRAALSALP